MATDDKPVLFRTINLHRPGAPHCCRICGKPLDNPVDPKSLGIDGACTGCVEERADEVKERKAAC